MNLRAVSIIAAALAIGLAAPASFAQDRAVRIRSASDEELVQTRQALSARIQELILLRELRDGVPAAPTQTAQASLRSFKKFTVSYRMTAPDAFCARYAATEQKLVSEITSGLGRYLTEHRPPKRHLLRARVEMLALFLENLHALLANGSEGGASVLTVLDQKRECPFADREVLLKAVAVRQTQLRELLTQAFGSRGVTNVNLLSRELAQAWVHQAQGAAGRYIAKLVVVSAVSLVAWELVVVRGLNFLVGANVLSAGAASVINRMLAAGAGGLTAFRAVSALSANTTREVATLGKPEEILTAAQAFLKLSVTDAESVYAAVSLVEEHLTQVLLPVFRAQRAQYAIARQKWGGLTPAIADQKQALAQVEAELQARQLTL